MESAWRRESGVPSEKQITERQALSARVWREKGRDMRTEVWWKPTGRVLKEELSRKKREKKENKFHTNREIIIGGESIRNAWYCLEAAGTQSTWHSNPGGETEKQTDHCVRPHRAQAAEAILGDQCRHPRWGCHRAHPAWGGGRRAHEAAQDARTTKWQRERTEVR